MASLTHNLTTTRYCQPILVRLGLSESIRIFEAQIAEKAILHTHDGEFIASPNTSNLGVPMALSKLTQLRRLQQSHFSLTTMPTLH